MKKILGIVLFFTLSILNCFAQIDEKEQIKASGLYYYGEAVANSSKEASDQALKFLTQSISITIHSEFQKKTDEIQQQKGGDYKEVTEDILKTYSTATLKNVLTIRKPLGGQIEVFHYIKKSEVSKIYDERKRTVFNIFDQASEFEASGNYGGALKWYYFSMILMNSIPEQNIMYRDLNLSTEIAKKINYVLQNVRFTLNKDESRNQNQERELTFTVSLDNKPVQFIEFNYFDGFDLVNTTASDGVAVMMLYGPSVEMKNLTVGIRYSFYEARNEIIEVGQLWDLVSKPQFKSAIFVDLKKQVEKLHIKVAPISAVKDSIDQTNSGISLIKPKEIDAINPVIVTEIQDTLPKIISVFNHSGISEIAEIYNSDAFLGNKLKSIKSFNNTRILDEPLEGFINKTYDGFEYRRVAALNKYASLSKQTREYIVLDFSPNGQITDMNFGIMDDLYNRFVKQAEFGNDWGNREVIIKFMERYRTAYMTRNMEMLNQMFADEAVIIVGRVMNKGVQNKSYDYVQTDENQPKIEYLKYTKDEYLKKQKQVFDVHKDIYLGFTNFQIMRKNNAKGVYGISMRQNYNASNYADEGYLFLLVDFNEEKPQIYVRSWQPQEWVEQALVDLSNFNINK
jgi:hypothetical protein